MYLHSLFKLENEEPKNRKPWYQRAMEIAAGLPPISGEPTSRKLRKSSSLREGASTFTRACLCAPIFSSTPAPKRQRPAPPPPPPPDRDLAAAPPRASGDGRRLFRGKSLTDDLVMRRFVVEEAMVVQNMRRMSEMDFVRKRTVSRRRKKLGKSPLSRMTMADKS